VHNPFPVHFFNFLWQCLPAQATNFPDVGQLPLCRSPPLQDNFVMLACDRMRLSVIANQALVRLIMGY